MEISQAQLERNRGKQATARLEHIATRRAVVEDLQKRVGNLTHVSPEMRDPAFARALPGLVEQLHNAETELAAAQDKHSHILALEALPPISAEEREALAKANREREAAGWIAKRDASAAMSALKKWPPASAVATAAPASVTDFLGPEPVPELPRDHTSVLQRAIAARHGAPLSDVLQPAPIKRKRGRPPGTKKTPGENLAARVARATGQAVTVAMAAADPRFVNAAAALAARGGTRHG